MTYQDTTYREISFSSHGTRCSGWHFRADGAGHGPSW